MGKRKKFGKIGAPNSPKRKAWMRKISKKHKKKPRIDEREEWRNGRKRDRAGKFSGKGKKMNPALETILLVAEISHEAWNRLPDKRKEQIHRAVANGQIELARRLGRA